MEDFIYNYFIEPINAHSGYNMVNTLVYAAIALIALYGVFLFFKKRNVRIDRTFIYGVLTFVLFGSTMRVVTDSLDSGAFTAITPLHKFILDSHILDYGFFTVSPMVYVNVAFLFLLSFYVLKKINRYEWLPYVGLVLWIPNMFLLLFFMEKILYAIPILVLAFIPAYLTYRYFKNDVYAMMVGAHALDGAATFIVIDFGAQICGLSYFEQHVIPSFIGGLLGTYFLFYLVKIAIAFGAAYVINKEKATELEKNFISIVIIVMGLAPGVRDVLRMLACT